MSYSQVTRQEQANAYKEYCAALQLQSGLTGEELREHIRETVRQSYEVLFQSKTIRQRDLNENQLALLCYHRKTMTYLMTQAQEAKV
jgi:hypothetical protein